VIPPFGLLWIFATRFDIHAVVRGSFLCKQRRSL